MSIHILADEVVNQIAAGEVVERPAHLVKELCENALDAGSTEVTVKVSRGGRDISVKDNGCGISESDLPLAILRHSTSKLHTADDLWSLQSYGFRGEALASIAAVSDLAICSRPAGAEYGARLKCRFGASDPVTQLGSESGTEVTISHLFENVPARLKFLKSANAEVAQIRSVVKALALANPSVQWRFLVESKLDLFYAKGSAADRVSQVFSGLQVFTGNANLSGYQCEVWFVDPHETVKTNKHIWIFVQGRWVQDRALNAAVMEGYRNILMHHEYPQIVVLLQAPLDCVDVNIHPTKSQVKFENPSDAFRSIVHAIRNGLEKAEWLKLAVPSQIDNGRNRDEFEPENRQASFYRPIEPRQLQVASPELEQTHFRSRMTSSFNRPEPEPLTTALKVEEWKQIGQSRKDQISPLVETRIDLDTKGGAQDRDNGAIGYWGSLQVVGQVGLTYIICQSHEGMVIIDQHAADERVRFEKIKSQIESGRFIWQELLFPIVIDMTPEKKEAVLALSERLTRLGVKIEEMGPTSVSVVSHADWVTEHKLPELLNSIADQFIELGESFILEQQYAHWIATQACHGAIRAGKALSSLEIHQLLKEMDAFPLSSFCPHGRPVSIKRTFLDLDKEFGRIVT